MVKNLKKLPDGESFNNSFMTKSNLIWFNFVISNWYPDENKPLIALPCGKANKTRNKYGKKMISQGMGHQLLSAITRCDKFERVILSEPLTIIPYSLESHEFRPDYNLPAKDLSIQSEQIFIRQLAFWLILLKNKQKKRKYIYYIGGKHHFFILKFANKLAGEPFKLVFKIPKRGLIDYGPSAKEFKKEILELENNGIMPELEEPNLEKYLKTKGRYTGLPLWKFIMIEQRNKRKKEIKNYQIEVTKEKDWEEGFSKLFISNPQISGEAGVKIY